MVKFYINLGETWIPEVADNLDDYIITAMSTNSYYVENNN